MPSVAEGPSAAQSVAECGGADARGAQRETMKIIAMFTKLCLSASVLVQLCACGGDGAGSDAGAGASDGGADGSAVDASDSEGGPKQDAGEGDGASEPLYQCEAPPPVGGDVAKDMACCDGLGVCLELAADAGAGVAVGDCRPSEGLRCVPQAVLEEDAGVGDAGADDAGSDPDAGGPLLPVTCHMKLSGAAEDDPGLEGRCVPECLARGTSASLEQGECDAGSICVPCYSAITGDSTGVCNQAGDAPVEEPPAGFAECGDTLGYCIARSLVPETTNLPQLTCGDGEVCAPKQSVTAPDSCFARCDSQIAGPGACVPGYLVPVDSQGFLFQDSCVPGELCSPCINPTTGDRTGACD